MLCPSQWEEQTQGRAQSPQRCPFPQVLFSPFTCLGSPDSPEVPGPQGLLSTPTEIQQCHLWSQVFLSGTLISDLQGFSSYSLSKLSVKKIFCFSSSKMFKQENLGQTMNLKTNLNSNSCSFFHSLWTLSKLPHL